VTHQPDHPSAPAVRRQARQGSGSSAGWANTNSSRSRRGADGGDDRDAVAPVRDQRRLLIGAASQLRSATGHDRAARVDDCRRQVERARPAPVADSGAPSLTQSRTMVRLSARSSLRSAAAARPGAFSMEQDRPGRAPRATTKTRARAASRQRQNRQSRAPPRRVKQVSIRRVSQAREPEQINPLAALQNTAPTDILVEAGRAAPPPGTAATQDPGTA